MNIKHRILLPTIFFFLFRLICNVNGEESKFFFVQNSEVKASKEEFVRNLEGSSMIEIFFQFSIFLVFVFLNKLMKTFLEQKKNNESSRQGILNSDNKHFVFDFVSIIIPYLLIMTVASEWLFFCLFFSFFLIFVLVQVLNSRNKNNLLNTNLSHPIFKDKIFSRKKTFLSLYRASMMISTIVTILAVDFPIFPRKYAKTENFGTGYMDIGVGSFVFANSIVAKRQNKIANSKKSFLFNILLSIKKSSPLLILGFARLLSIKSLNYQEHIGEYGLHWNFFFTLSFVSLFSSFFIFSSFLNCIIGLLILLTYQIFLSFFDLSNYLIYEERKNNIFDLNKEGIMSIIGYLSIYLFGCFFQDFFFSKFDFLALTLTLTSGDEANASMHEKVEGKDNMNDDKNIEKNNQKTNEKNIGEKNSKNIEKIEEKTNENKNNTAKFFSKKENKRNVTTEARMIEENNRLFWKWMIKICIIDLILWSFTLILDTFVERISRKTCNASYAFWVLSQNIFIIIVLLFIEFFFPFYSISIFESVDKNLLPTFLLANVLTGMVNMTMSTLSTPSHYAFLVLAFYMIIVLYIMHVLHRKNISLKFW